MGNKEEITNLIGRKGSKMTVLRCHKVCSKTFEVKSNTVRLKRDKKKIQKRFLHTPEQTLEEKAKNWKWTPGK